MENVCTGLYGGRTETPGLTFTNRKSADLTECSYPPVELATLVTGAVGEDRGSRGLAGRVC